jgi:DNA-binding MarR family transcriptional regulator
VAPPRLDPVVHEPVRLLALAALAERGSLPFGELRRAVGATAGNLGIHARRLEEAGYVAVRKSFVGRVPRTELRLTAKGRAALRRYAAAMRRVLSRA